MPQSHYFTARIEQRACPICGAWFAVAYWPLPGEGPRDSHGKGAERVLLRATEKEYCKRACQQHGAYLRRREKRREARRAREADERAS